MVEIVLKEEVHFVCIDTREKHEDGTTHIVLKNGQRLLMPPNIKKVPSILLLCLPHFFLKDKKHFLHYFH